MNRFANSRPTMWYAVIFSAEFSHAGVHYLEADTHRIDATRHVFLRDDQEVWAAPSGHVREVRCFATHPEALAFHRRHTNELVKNPVPPRAARTKPMSPIIEGFTARMRPPTPHRATKPDD